MENFLLTEAERSRFIEWLDRNAYSAEQLIQAMDQAGLPSIVKQTMQQAYRNEVEACRFVAQKLKSSETYTIRQ